MHFTRRHRHPSRSAPVFLLSLATFTAALLLADPARSELPRQTMPLQPAGDAKVRVVVDPRIELMTIVFRLAGAPEHSYAAIESYARDVDAHFGAFRDHPVVVRARELRRTRHISFSDPVELALNLTGVPELAERAPFEQSQAARSRWTAADARVFLADLRAFARDTNAAGFFAAHDPLYRTSVERLETMVRQAGLVEWLDRFFRGRDDVRYVIAANLLNASGSFGGMRVRRMADAAGGGRTASGSEGEDFYVALGAQHAGPDGMPAFPSTQASIVAHEVCHTFMSPIVKAHIAELARVADRMYPPVQADMERQQYGPGETILHESLVRACSVRYTASRDGAEAGRRQAAVERERWFLAVDRLADLLAEYEKQPAAYPTIEAFAPRIVAFFEEYSRVAAPEAAAIRAGQRARQEAGDAPRVVSMTPEHDASNVDAGSVKALTITFDRPMRHMAVVELPGLVSPAFTGRPVYDATSRVLTVPCRLEPGTAYGLQLNSPENMVMTDERGTPLPPVVYRFRTKK